MQEGRGGMGNHKHGVSGHTPKSPKLRLKLKMEAEKNERKPRKSITKFGTFQDLFKGS